MHSLVELVIELNIHSKISKPSLVLGYYYFCPRILVFIFLLF